MTPTLEGVERGRWAEETYRRALKDAQRNGIVEFYHRPEWLVWPANDPKPYLVEVKGQERFLAPPFDGHGLPAYQADRYMLAWTRLKLRTWFIVYEPAGDVFGAWLDELEAGPQHETRGTRDGPRRIYALDSFEHLGKAVAA